MSAARLALRLIALTVAALAASGAAGAAPVRVVDDQRRTVELAQPARRAIALAPHAAELVYAAGAGDRLVGAVRGTDYPPAALSCPA